MAYNSFKLRSPLPLEGGEVLEQAHLAYTTYGELNKLGDNAVFVCHAFSASSDVADWWQGLFGKGNVFDDTKDFIVCPNIIGSPYGSVCPLDINPKTGEMYGKDFPLISVKDLAQVYLSLIDHLGINRIKLLIGGSFGGHQAQELAHIYSGSIDHLVLIATSARETAWSIAIHEAQRLAIEADQTFVNNHQNGGLKGLKAARGMALLHYRTGEAYAETQAEEDDRLRKFKAASYINYQGEKMVKRFNAYSYYALLNSLDTHNIGRDRQGVKKALETISCKTLCIGIDSDTLIPTSEQKKIAQFIPDSEYQEVESKFGHDGFLIETVKIAQIIKTFMFK